MPKVFVDAAAGWNRQVKPRQGGRSAWWRGGAAFILLVTALTGCIPSSDAPAGPNRAADLASLEVTSGGEKVSISPAFNPDVTNYTVQVGGATESIEVKATVADARATTRINNQITPSGQAQTIALSPGSNTITIAVSAPGADKVYTLVATRGTNANLANLILSPGGLAEVFDPEVLSYTALVGNQTTSIQVTATAADSSAIIRINGQPVQSGQAATISGLTVGQNAVTVIVTALNNSTKTYTVVVTRSASGIADLSGIEVVANGQSLPLLPGFTTSNTQYSTAQVPFSTSTVNVSATLSDTTATLTINGVPRTSAQTLEDVPFPANGSNAVNLEITLVVTAQDGTTQKVYKVIVPRAAASSNATLTNLTATPPGGTIAGFSPNVTNYVLNVSNSTTSVAFVATPAPAASVSYIYLGQTTPGNSFTASNLPVGNSVVTIQVEAEAGNSTPYQVTINRAASGNADLSNLEAFAGASASGPNLISGFNSAVTSYTVTIPFTVDQVTVRATKDDPNATVSINGQNVSVLTVGGLAVGSNQNVFSIVVTPQSGPAKNYLVSVNRQAASSNNNLSNLQVFAGPSATGPNLITNFSSGTLSYAVTIANSFTQVTVVATKADATASVSINNQVTNMLTVSTPNVGQNLPPISIVVTAQDGSPKTYQVTVTRQGSGNNNLSNLQVFAGSTATGPNLITNFSSGTQNYAVTIANSFTQVTVVATKADATASVAINNQVTNQLTVSTPNVGQNLPPISIVVTAQDGSQKPYQVTVTRQPPPPSTDAGLANLQVFAGATATPPALALTPSFSPPGQTASPYTTSTSNTQVTIVVTKSDPNATISGAVVSASGQAAGQATITLGPANPTQLQFVVTPPSGAADAKTYRIDVTKTP